MSNESVPTQRSAEERRAELARWKKEKSRTYRQYKTAIAKRWNPFIEDGVKNKNWNKEQVERFVNDNGEVAEHVVATAEEFARFMDNQPDMSLSIISNALSWMARELNDQLYIAGKPSVQCIREIQEVKKIESKYKKHPV